MTRHRVLDDQPHAGVLIHCSAGRRRSAMLAYAVLHLRGHDRTRAVALVLRYRPQAQLVPAYVHSVEAGERCLAPHQHVQRPCAATVQVVRDPARLTSCNARLSVRSPRGSSCRTAG